MSPAAWTFTWFRRHKVATGGLRVTMDRDELAFALGDPPVCRNKFDLPLLCPCTFRDDHRRNANVESAAMLGLDLDAPQVDPNAYVARVAEALGGVELFGYSTHSSMPEAFKLRALVPYDRAANADEHRGSWKLVARLAERNGIQVDRQCSDPARGFFTWAVPPSGVYFHKHIPGAPWPVRLAAEVEAERVANEARRLEREERARAARRPESSIGIAERARRYVASMPVAIAGAGGHAATFAVARRLVADFELSDSDAWAVLGEYNLRCQPPWSERELRHKLASAQAARVRLPMVER